MDFREVLKQRADFYNFTPVLWEMLKVIHNKELAFLSAKGTLPKKAFRFFWANGMDSLKSHLQFTQCFDLALNLYCSVADLKFPLPIFSYHLEKRKLDTKYIEFNRNYVNYVKNYSIFYDFDGKTKVGEEYVVDMDKCYKEVARFKEILDEYKIPYYLIPSSFNGFHIIISSEYIEYNDLDKLISDLNILINRITYDYGFEMLDNTVVDIKRIRKLPYSMSCDGAIVLPLTDYEFKNFDKKMLTWDFVKRNIVIKNRGLMIREHNCNQEQLKQNVKRFIYEHTN